MLLLPVTAEEAENVVVHTSVILVHKVYNGIGNMHTKYNPGSTARTAETLRGDGRVRR